MKSKCLVIAMGMVLLLVALPGFSVAELIVPVFYDAANDIPAWQFNGKEPSNETVDSLRNGAFTSVELLPLGNDSLLWYGTFEYHELVREEAHRGSYDREMPRTDAYAVAVNSEGKRLWSLRISDPQSENEFSNAWLMDDGRILLKFNDFLGEWSSQYYIVSQEGEVQEMLPAYRTKAYGVLETLQPIHEGFIGGGYEVDESGYSPMLNEVNVTYFDKELNMLWRSESHDYLASSLGVIKEADDGIILAGGIFKSYVPRTTQPIILTPLITKLDFEGKPMWSYQGNAQADGSIQDAWPTRDGGAVFVTWIDPSKPTAYGEVYAGTLTKIDSNGELEWTRQYQTDFGFVSFESVVSYQNGFLLAGMVDDGSGVAALHVAENGEPIQVIDVKLNEADSRYIFLTQDQNENVYMYGATINFGYEDAGIEQRTNYFPFYIKLDK